MMGNIDQWLPGVGGRGVVDNKGRECHRLLGGDGTVLYPDYGYMSLCMS